MKRLALAIIVPLVMVILAGLDYRVNFKESPFFPVTQTISQGSSLENPVQGNPPLNPVEPSAQGSSPTSPTPPTPPTSPTPTPPPAFSGAFPSLLASSSAEFPYIIRSQQRVFDLFGLFDLNALPGLQILRYDVVPANSDSALSPVQVYELKRVEQSSGITFLSLKAELSRQVSPPSELAEVQQEYANHILFYNPFNPSENAFLLAENTMVLGFVYPKASAETFQAIQNFLGRLPTFL